MGKDEKPLIKKDELVEAIQKHFMLKLEVNETELIGRFLKLKKEERADTSGAYGLRTARPKARAAAGGAGARAKVALASNSLGTDQANYGV